MNNQIFKSYLLNSKLWALGYFGSRVFLIVGLFLFASTYHGRSGDSPSILELLDVDHMLHTLIWISFIPVLIIAFVFRLLQRKKGAIEVSTFAITLGYDKFHLSEISELKFRINSKPYGLRNFVTGARNYISFRARDSFYSQEFFIGSVFEEDKLKIILDNVECEVILTI